MPKKNDTCQTARRDATERKTVHTELFRVASHTSRVTAGFGLNTENEKSHLNSKCIRDTGVVWAVGQKPFFASSGPSGVLSIGNSVLVSRKKNHSFVSFHHHAVNK